MHRVPVPQGLPLLRLVSLAQLFATIHSKAGNKQAARDCLETMIAKVKASPIYHYRRHQPLVRKAEKMLKAL